MTITVNDKKKIFEIQKEFNDLFPYLQIQFFTKPHKPGGLSPKNQMVDTQKSLGGCRTIHNKGSIIISPIQSVKTLEQSFQNVFGLSVQVFRKSGKAWLETNVTDDWTLEEQNKEGQALSRIVKKDRPDDFHLSED